MYVGLVKEKLLFWKVNVGWMDERVKEGAVVGCGGRVKGLENNTRGRAIVVSDDPSLGYGGGVINFSRRYATVR